jgi:carbon storage regulator
MLVLTRKRNQSIVIDGNIRVTVVDIHGNHVRLGFEAPESVAIMRQELCEATGNERRPRAEPRPVSRQDAPETDRWGAREADGRRRILESADHPAAREYDETRAVNR